MNDNFEAANHRPPANEPLRHINGPPTQLLHLCYLLFAIALIMPLSGLVGVIMAYVLRREFSDRLSLSHLAWLINTFWVYLGICLLGLVLGIVSGVTSLMLANQGYHPWSLFIMLPIGLLLAAGFIWVIYRIASGWIRLIRRRQPQG